MKGRRLRGPVTAGLVMTIAAAAMAAPAAAVALSASPASATVATAHASHRGQLVSATPLRTFKDRAAVAARLKADGFNPATIVKEPYARTIEGLFDGRHTGDQVIGSLPATVRGLLTPYGVHLLQHPTGGFAAALRSVDSVCQGSRHLGSNVAGTAQIVRWFLSLSR
jgi:hypothetical protein